MDIMCNLLGAAFLLPLGAALGSFFEVVLDRVPRGESLLWPPSHCRTCRRRLTADELVPVISYLAQRGRCRACDTPIGRGVPIREALSGLALALPWALGGCGHPVAALIAGVALLVMIWIIQSIRQARRPPAGAARN
ncbi:MAG: leader peptidase (prepilin peptidase) / N-methyltransferase [Chloroflexota bacterium]|jgi:prepilin signal peptidase PulO-like enzyme (type II secretory pathway)|nr:leader peptidase (prepilin peptidase) / N-methyltransferase [Chloroflexota bacterium]